LSRPVSGSVIAAVLWRNSVRSFDIASRMKAVAMVIRKASRLSTLSHAFASI